MVWCSRKYELGSVYGGSGSGFFFGFATTQMAKVLAHYFAAHAVGGKRVDISYWLCEVVPFLGSQFRDEDSE